MPRPSGYWKDFRNVEAEIRALCKLLGDAMTLPSESQMRRHHLGALDNAIRHHHGGRPVVAKLLGIRTKRLKYGSLESFAVLKKELLKWIDRHGTPGVMPLMDEFKQAQPKRNDLVHAIADHGGPRYIAKRLGLRMQHDKKDDGYYENFENVAAEVRMCVRECKIPGRMPTPRQMRDCGFSTAAQFISNKDKFGGFEIVAIRLGLIPNKKRWTPARVDEAVLSFASTVGVSGQMPTDTELRALGWANLANAITRHSEGTRDIAKRLKLTSRASKPDGYWDDPDNMKREILDFMSEYGIFGTIPTQKQFCDGGRSDIAVAIARTPGGVPEVASWLDLKLNERPKGYWTFENVAKEIIEFNQFNWLAAIQGFVPPNDLLNANGRADLTSAIVKHGGTRAVAKRMGFRCISDEKWHSLIERYIAYELKLFFDFNPRHHKIRCAGEQMDVDILIPRLKLIIEYDSDCFHNHPQRVRRDTIKTLALQAERWTVIRAREQVKNKARPMLQKITENDVLVPSQSSQRTKAVVDAILKGIVSACGITLNGLEDYLNKRSLQNDYAARDSISDDALKGRV